VTPATPTTTASTTTILRAWWTPRLTQNHQPVSIRGIISVPDEPFIIHIYNSSIIASGRKLEFGWNYMYSSCEFLIDSVLISDIIFNNTECNFVTIFFNHNIKYIRLLVIFLLYEVLIFLCFQEFAQNEQMYVSWSFPSIFCFTSVIHGSKKD
jgi:hypothetical protein